MTETSQRISPSRAPRRAAFALAQAGGRRVRALTGAFGSIRTRLALLGLAAALVVVIAAVTAGTLWHFRAKAIDEAERQIRNLNGVLAEQTAGLRQGLSQDLCREITRLLRERMPKLKTQIQGDAVRVTGKSKDELQSAIAILRKAEQDRNWPVPLQFVNYR